MAWIEKREKKYRVVWDVGTPDNRERRIVAFDRPEDAKAFRSKIEVDLNSGTYIEPSKMTFGEYLDHWIRLHGDNISPKTLDSYTCEIKNHIKPNLGKIKLSKLTPMHVQDYYAHLRKEGKTDTARVLADKFQTEYDRAVENQLPPRDLKRIRKKLDLAKERLDNIIAENKGGLSSTSINYHHRIIHKALKQAVKWQMVARNIADAVEPPPPADTEIKYLKRDEVNKFISCIKESYYYPIIATAILTGMRQGEILGLRWQDVDFDEGIVKVRRQLQYITGKGYFYPKPKQKSIRNIPMPLPLNSVLRAVRKEQARIKSIYEEAAKENDGKNGYFDNDLIFCAYDGRPLIRSTVTRNLQSLLEKYGLAKIRFHALRHTFATMARGAGVPMEDIQDLLGHADISTTKNMYTHVEIEPLRDSIKKLTDYLSI